MLVAPQAGHGLDDPDPVAKKFWLHSVIFVNQKNQKYQKLLDILCEVVGHTVSAKEPNFETILATDHDG